MSVDRMERMERKRRYYVINNQKQTLVSFEVIAKEASSILKFDGINWVPDTEVYEVVKRCYGIGLMKKIATKITSDYEYDKIIDQKRLLRKQRDEQAQAELLEKIEKRDEERKANNSDSSDDSSGTKK